MLRTAAARLMRIYNAQPVVRRGTAAPRIHVRAFCEGRKDEDAKMHMMFTCGKCETRAMKSFSKRSYETGVVIATCPGCDAKHLIADNLRWFGEERNIEEIMASHEIKVPKVSASGDVEYTPKEEP